MKKNIYLIITLICSFMFISSVSAYNFYYGDSAFTYSQLENVYNQIVIDFKDYDYIFCYGFNNLSISCHTFRGLMYNTTSGSTSIYYSSQIAIYNVYNGTKNFIGGSNELESGFGSSTITFNSSNSNVLYYTKGIDVFTNRLLNTTTGRALVLTEDIYFNFKNSVPDWYSSIDKYNIVVSKDDENIKFYGIMNRLFEVEEKQIFNYSINYYYNDSLDSSKTITSSNFENSTITIENKSDSHYSIDNNTYEVTLTEDNQLFNIYYYDELWGTSYQQINTNNTHIQLPFNMQYLVQIFPSIDFTKFTMFEQFAFTLLFNIFFILFVFVFIYLLRMLWSYLYRLF